MNAKELAKFFHDTYEKLAPQFGYETRKDTQSLDFESPNGKLMLAVCVEVLKELRLDKLNSEEAYEDFIYALKEEKII